MGGGDVVLVTSGERDCVRCGLPLLPVAADYVGPGVNVLQAGVIARRERERVGPFGLLSDRMHDRCAV